MDAIEHTHSAHTLTASRTDDREHHPRRAELTIASSVCEIVVPVRMRLVCVWRLRCVRASRPGTFREQFDRD